MVVFYISVDLFFLNDDPQLLFDSAKKKVLRHLNLRRESGEDIGKFTLRESLLSMSCMQENLTHFAFHRNMFNRCCFYTLTASQ